MKLLEWQIKKTVMVNMVFLLFFFSVNDVAAQDEEQTWQYELTLYGWFSSVDSLMKFPRGPGQGDDLSFDASQIIENLKMIFMGAFEARHGKWGLLTDVIYMDVNGDNNQTLVSPGSGPPVTASIDLGIISWIVSAGVSYEVLQTRQGTLAVVGGVRYLTGAIDTTVGASGLFSQLDTSVRISESMSSLDGVIGVRGNINLNEHWYLPYYADIGTGQANLTWEALAGIGYRFSWGDIRLAYRYLSYDFGSDEVLQDLAMGGPILGIGFRF